VRLNASLRLIVSLVLAAGSSSGYATLSCTMPSGVSLNFGNYDDTSTANTDVSMTFTVSCCRNPPGANDTLSVALGPSTNSTAANRITTRQMKNSANTDRMNYQLYFGSFGGTISGNGVGGGSVLTQAISTNNNCPASTVINIGSPIFGRIAPQQPVSAGTYGDSLTIDILP